MKELTKNLISYLKVILITLLIIAIGVSISVWNLAFREYNIAKGNIERADIDLEGLKIKQLLEDEKEHPDDYTINIKLAMIYEKIGIPITADLHYKKALVKAPRSEYALYKYSLFCINEKRYPEAINLIENITDGPNRRIIGKKLAIYEKIADELGKSGDYQNSSKVYSLAYRYAKIAGGNKHNEILNKIEDTYLRLADQNISENNYEQAKLNLEALLKLKNNPLAEYKLALIYKPFDLKKTADYMTSAFEEDFKIVNLDIYYDVLEELRARAKKSGKLDEAKFYEHRQKRLKKFIENNLIFSDDLIIFNPTIQSEKKVMGKKWLNFDIANNSYLKIGTIYLKLDITFPNDKKETKLMKVDFDKNLAKQVRTVNLQIRSDGASLILNKSEYAKVTVYAKKNSKLDWILIKQFNVRYE